MLTKEQCPIYLKFGVQVISQNSIELLNAVVACSNSCYNWFQTQNQFYGSARIEFEERKTYSNML